MGWEPWCSGWVQSTAQNLPQFNSQWWNFFCQSVHQILCQKSGRSQGRPHKGTPVPQETTKRLKLDSSSCQWNLNCADLDQTEQGSGQVQSLGDLDKVVFPLPSFLMSSLKMEKKKNTTLMLGKFQAISYSVYTN